MRTQGLFYEESLALLETREGLPYKMDGILSDELRREMAYRLNDALYAGALGHQRYRPGAPIFEKQVDTVFGLPIMEFWQECPNCKKRIDAQGQCEC